MTNKINDGWHIFLGYRVWVEKNRVKYADVDGCGTGWIYRRVDGKWVQVNSVCVATFYTGVKLGYIRVIV